MTSQQKIAIFGYVDVDAAVRDEVVASTVELQRATRADELGCLVYVIAADPAHVGRIQIVELWDSADALDAHFQHPNFAATGAALRSVPRRGGASRKYRIDADDEVRGEDGMASAAFRAAGDSGA